MESNKPRYVLIMSGKGGVGKSTTAANVARCLADKLGKVGLLDLDLTGPSIPTIFGIKGESVKNHNGMMVPCTKDNVEIISLGLLLRDPNDAVIWRGPRKNSMISTFFDKIEWTAPIVVIDMPPGTSDEHLTTFQFLQEKDLAFSIYVVTTPNLLSIADVRKGLNLCETINAPVSGLIENFSGIMCPCCGEVTPLLGNNLVQDLAEEKKLPVLAHVPFMPAAAAASDAGEKCDLILPMYDNVIQNILN